MPPITAQLLAEIARGRINPLMAQLAPLLAAGLAPAGIDAPLRQAHFLAQAAYETAGFTRLEENLDYRASVIAATFLRLAARAADLAHNPQALANAAYAGRIGNGNEASGDGWRFRGRGLLMLTGRATYARMAARCNSDLLAEPDRAGEPPCAVESAIVYWNLHSINEAADCDDIEWSTRIVNGGLRGLPERTALKERALGALTRL